MGIVAECVGDAAITVAADAALKREKIVGYIVERVERKEIQALVEKWHYTHSINGVHSNYCFALKENGIIIGAAVVGILAMAGVVKKYEKLGYKNVLELRRLVCIDRTFRNAETFFIGRILRYLRQNTDTDLIVAYSDLNENHTGIIYKASNFVFLGKTGRDHKIKYGDKLYHSKCLRTKGDNGEYKPFVKKLREAYSKGDAIKIDILPKMCYIYSIRDKKYRNNING
jgi:hypothetical protein